MHKIILTIFAKIKSFIKFLQILPIFCILCLLLEWVEHLTDAYWSFLDFIRPLLNAFLNFANIYAKDTSLNLFGAAFEYKYALALIIFVALYYFFVLLYEFTNFTEDKYGDIRTVVKKHQEKSFNNSLQKEQKNESKKIRKYRVYIATQAKQENQYGFKTVNLEEQNKILNKFMIEKTTVLPEVYKDGYLYTFTDFFNIDEKIGYLFKILKSEAPINYQICIQIITSEKNKDIEQRELDEIISLKIQNKITFLADLVWRYNFNTQKKYQTSQVGVFQNQRKTYEVHEFIENI